MVDYYAAIHRALEFVENNLCEPFTIEDVSRAAFQSRWHFQRIFRLVTGYSLYAYVKRRRLAEAGSELLMKGARVIDVALKYQYGSPEAFARAFQAEYGFSPSEVKQRLEHRIFPPMDLRERNSAVLYKQGDIEFYPASRASITLFGKTYRTSMRDKRNERDVPMAWRDFYGKGLDRNIVNRIEGANYGVYFDWDYEENFTILLGCPVQKNAGSDPRRFLESDPEDVNAYRLISVKPCKYMVFTVPGSSDEEIIAGWNYIYGNWMPNGGYERDYSVDFDVFDDRFFSSSPVSEIYIPIK